MICQKCNHILSGSESFCPDCGTPLAKEKEFYREPEAPSVIFSPEKESASPIFADEAPRHIPPEKREKRPKAGLYLVVVLCLVIIGAVVISATELIDFTPAIASLFSLNENEETTAPEPSSLSQYDPVSGIITPSVNYKTTVAYVTGNMGQALRKGPDGSYGQIEILPVGSTVHIIGGASVGDSWVYVYAPETDAYGWISDSFLSSSLSQINPDQSTNEATTKSEDSEE